MQRLIPSHPLIPSDRRDVAELEQTFTTCDPNAQCTMAFVSKVRARGGGGEGGLLLEEEIEPFWKDQGQ